MADERVVPLLPKLLGKKWFEAKKQPIPVCLKRKDLKGELERAISSTYMNQNQGTCTSIKIATLTHKPTQVIANLQKALPTIVANIKDGWENIQALHIKTNSSVSLPIWTCALDSTEGGRWHALDSEDAEMGVEGGGSESENAAPEPAKEAKDKGGKKRALAADVEMEEAPKKRSKGTKDAPTKPPKASKAEAGPAKKPAKVDAPEPPKDVSASSKKTKAKKTKATPVELTEKLAPSASATKVGLKAKREGKPLEKKKGKVVKQKSGQSVKDKLLGKKAAQS